MNSTLEIVRRFYDALSRGDVPAALARFDPHVEWTEAERFPYYGGTWRNPYAIVKGLFEPLGRDWSRFEVKPKDFVTEGDQTVGFGTYVGTHKRTGRLAALFGYSHNLPSRESRSGSYFSALNGFAPCLGEQFP